MLIGSRKLNRYTGDVGRPEQKTLPFRSSCNNIMIKENKYFKIVEDKSPHIAKKVAFLWGEPEFNKVMNNLMNDSRNGLRQGFSTEVSTALFELMLEHDRQFPDFGPSEPSDLFKY